MIRIAGTSFDFHAESPDCPLSLPLAYQPFVTECTHDTVTGGSYRILHPDHPRLPALTAPPFWSNEIWRMGPVGTNGIGIEIFNVMASLWVPVAELAGDFSSGRIQPFHGRRATPGPHALNYPYDQAILINRLLHRQVTVVHGAGIVHNGRGFVFFGPSGIGKTTISRLWVKRGARLLNDDRVAVYRSEQGTWHVAGTPWHGEEPIVSTERAPLAAVVRLRQAATPSVRQLSPVEGLSEILGCALIPFFSREGIERAMDLFGAMIETVPVVELSFRPDQASLDYFLQRMEVR